MEPVPFGLLGLPFPAILRFLLDKLRNKLRLSETGVVEPWRFPLLRGPVARGMEQRFPGQTCRIRVRGKASQAGKTGTFWKRAWQDSNLRHTARKPTDAP